MDILFLDANILFSVAYGSPKIGQLWDIARKGRCLLITSPYVVEEVRRNLDNPEHLIKLEKRLREVKLVDDPPLDLPCPIKLPEKDEVVFRAALSCKATHFITGDIQHFRPFYRKKIHGILILTPAEYLSSYSAR